MVDGNLPIETSNQPIEPIAEKKTLTVDFPLEEVPFPTKEVQSSEFKVQSQETEQNSAIEDQRPKTEDQNFNSIESMPIKFPPISADELEHTDDSWLDDAFERKLQMLGDNLSPIPNASKIVEVLLGENFTNQVSTKIETSNGGTATAFAPAKETIAFVLPGYEKEFPTKFPNCPKILPKNSFGNMPNNILWSKKHYASFAEKLSKCDKMRQVSINSH